ITQTWIPNAQAVNITSGISSGKLGGILQARDTDAVALQTKLDTLASDVAGAMNTQHALGRGLDAIGGRNLFTVPTLPAVITATTLSLDAAMVGHPERLAAANTSPPPGGSDNALALTQIGNKKIASVNTRTPAEAYSDIVGDVGIRKSGASQDAQVRSSMKAQAKSMRDSASGVSLDEEMISLSKYQRAYEASAKLLRTADELLTTFMQAIG
ncbi:MAG: flagellar basal body rod C-terminal domain-containing protein, partial [Myxococcales bacterium]